MAQAYQPGDRLDGRYTLKDFLGSGGAGVVFRAEVDATKKPVLIKIQEDRTSEAQQAILQREIDALRRLNHPKIAQLLDVRRTDDGKLFLCREFVEGVTLRELLQAQGALSARVARDILLDIADALAYAHERDVIFRDLKPENVIVSRNGSTYTAKLVDFGAFGNLQEDSGQTRTGQFVGTPIYMSPEQVRGLAQTARTDVYGVGMLGYEMLYGRPPERPTETVFRLLTAIVTKDVEFPDLPEVPVPLLELMRACLQREAELRPSSGEVLSRLRNMDLNPRALTLVQGSRASAGAAAAPAAQPMMSRAAPPAPQPQWAGKTAIPSPSPSIARVPPAAARGPKWIWIAIATGIILGTFLVLLYMAGTAPVPLRPGGGGNNGAARAAVGLLSSFVGVLVGIALLYGGFVVHRLVRRALARQRGELGQKATDLLLLAKGRERLNRTIVFELDRLMQQATAPGERLLGLTVVHMFNEFQQATQSKERQDALMNFIQLVEKLTDKLSPWYVKQEKVISGLAALLTSTAGLVTAGSNLMKMFHR